MKYASTLERSASQHDERTFALVLFRFTRVKFKRKLSANARKETQFCISFAGGEVYLWVVLCLRWRRSCKPVPNFKCEPCEAMNIRVRAGSSPSLVNLASSSVHTYLACLPLRASLNFSNMASSVAPSYSYGIAMTPNITAANSN